MKFLTVSLMALFLLVQSLNFGHKEAFVQRPRYQVLEFSIGNTEKRRRFEIPSLGHFNFKLGFDYSTNQLKRWGHLLRWRLWHPSSNGIVISKNSQKWIFMNEDFCVSSSVTQNRIAELKSYMEEIYGQAEMHNTRVLTLLVPTKAAIEWPYAEFTNLCNPFEVSQTKSLTEEFEAVNRTLVQVQPDWVIDLFPHWKKFKETHPQDSLYAPMGTHWSSTAVKLTGEILADRLKSLGYKVNTLEYKGNIQEPFEKDFLKLMGLELDDEPDVMETVYVPLAEKKYSHPSEIHVFGSCYTQSYTKKRASLPQIAASVLGREIREFASVGGGASGGIQMFSASGQKVKPGDLIIWEIPIRQVMSEVSINKAPLTFSK